MNLFINKYVGQIGIEYSWYFKIKIKSFSPVDLEVHISYDIKYQVITKYGIKHVSYFYVREGLNEYKYSPQNYISMGDKFYKIKSRRTLLRLFGEKSGEVKRFLHLSRIRIRQADKNQIVSVLKFYDSLVTTVRWPEWRNSFIY